MKQRVSYLLPHGHGVNPADITVKNDSLSFAGAGHTAEERRTTVGLNELPDELRLVLQDCHELHIRWSAYRDYKSPSPLISRIPPGLHVYFTPHNIDADVQLCPLLHRLFGRSIECESVSESFSRPLVLSERFSSSSTYQYHHELPSLRYLRDYAQESLCSNFNSDATLLAACSTEATAVQNADYIDIDYDTISHAVTLTAFWSASASTRISDGSTKAVSAARPIRKLRTEDSIEVGVLAPEKPDEPEELSMGGFLAVIGQDSKPGPTMFSFPSRHHPVPVNDALDFRMSFEQPTGLHPKMLISFNYQKLKPPREDCTCALHAYLTIPSALFIDRYQLSDPLYLASQNLISLRAISGEQDLEAPDWVIKRWGSAALFELQRPPYSSSSKKSTNTSDEMWEVSIPTHLRYLAPFANSTSSGYVNISIPYPAVFWACEAEEGLKMSVNPFDRVNLGYDGLFGPKTMFYHVPPAETDWSGLGLTETLTVPVLNAKQAEWVSTGTAMAVLGGFAWVMWRLLRRSGFRRGEMEMARKEQ